MKIFIKIFIAQIFFQIAVLLQFTGYGKSIIDYFIFACLVIGIGILAIIMIDICAVSAHINFQPNKK